MKSIYWFRQDLRTYDNIGFIQALKENKEILPIFILDNNIIPGFWGLVDNKFLFLKDCLLNLESELEKLWLKLHIFLGKPEVVIPKISKETGITTIYANRTYSRYGMKRDYDLSQSFDIRLYKDFLIRDPEEIPTRKIVAAYFKIWSEKNKREGIHVQDVPLEKDRAVLYDYSHQNARNMLEKHIPWGKHPYFQVSQLKERLKRDYKNYWEDRNIPYIDGTSKLAPFVRFWVLSIRELALSVKDNSFDFYRELAFRDFWNHFATNFPFMKDVEFQEKRRLIPWNRDEEAYFKWCRWETGYPIVDAAMKQLVEENWMHWRTRMIVCSFLVKDLLIDWRWGEAFFKQHLLDYDENINFSTWQWGASTGNDYSPMRIFSPIRQSERFDPQAVYIRKYLPQLEGEELKAIHNPLKYKLNYIPTMIDHSEAQRNTKEVYKKATEQYNLNK